MRVSADGVCLAFHDAALDRVMGRPGLVRNTLSRDVPGIATTIQVLRAFPEACFTIDIKEEAAVAPLARALRDANAMHRVCAAARGTAWLARLREATGPGLTTALGWQALASLLASARAKIVPPCSQESARCAHLPARLISRRALTAAQALGIRTVAWTVNDPAYLHRLLDAGVDGIITERPDPLREVLIARDQWTAPSDSRVS